MKKEIKYDRETKDFRAELNGNLIGYFRTRLEAETALDAAAYKAIEAGEGKPEPWRRAPGYARRRLV